MSITVESLIRAGAMAKSYFDLREDFDLRIFPSNCPEIVTVYETPKPIAIEEGYPSPYASLPDHDNVKLLLFGGRYNQDLIRMGYSERLNILCLSLV